MRPRIAAALGAVAAVAAALLAATATPAQGTTVTHGSLTLPARTEVVYPWYPGNWTQGPGTYPASQFTPSAGYYSQGGGGDHFPRQVDALAYMGTDIAAYSWWGQGSSEDGKYGTFEQDLTNSGVKTAAYYEPEGYSDPTAAQITSDLNYLWAQYGQGNNYAWVAGHPVIFVYADASDACGMASRWEAGNAAAVEQFYVVLKVFSGYATCADQPDNWHQYAPSSREDHQGAHSFSISPGFFKYNEASPRLARSVSAFQTAADDMVCSGADFQVITTFNEWQEGTGVEGLQGYGSPSGFGQFADVLHNETQCAAPPPPPPTSGHKVLVVIEENHSQADALANMPFVASLGNTYGKATNYHGVIHPSLGNYLAIADGDSFGVTDDADPPAHAVSGDSVFDQTIAAGRRAKTYAQSMTSNCQRNSSGLYATKHNPWAYNMDAAQTANCQANDVPAGTTSSGALHDDIVNGRLPATGFLIPDLCHDAHNGGCSLQAADDYFKSWFNLIQAGPDWQGGKLTVIVTFDEDDGSSGNTVAFVVADPALSGKVVTGTYNHYSLTKWLDRNAGAPDLRNAATAPGLKAAFGL